MTAPRVVTLDQHANPVATVGNTEDTTVGKAPWAGVVTKVEYVPDAAQAGAATNSRTLQLFNRRQDGTGTSLVAELALVSGVNLVAADAKDITLTAVVADKTFAAGDEFEWISLAVGTGIADPGGLVRVELTKS
jgi:hypothetical protein